MMVTLEDVVEKMVESMDLKSLESCCTDHLTQEYQDYSQEELEDLYGSL